jgi:hypothetical protein
VMDFIGRLIRCLKRKPEERHSMTDEGVKDELDHLKQSVGSIDKRVSELESERDPFDAFVKAIRGKDGEERRH